MRIKRHNLTSELKRIENCKGFKNKLKLFITKLFLFYTRVLVTTNGNLVIPVSFDMIQKCINGVRTAIFAKCVTMLCFTWLTCVFGSLSIFIALYWIAGNFHPWLVSYSKGILIKKGLYCTLCCIFFRSCRHVVFGCFQLTCPIVPV
jgi:hypothetical protein